MRELWRIVREFVGWVLQRAKPERVRRDGELEVFFDDTQIELEGKYCQGVGVHCGGRGPIRGRRCGWDRFWPIRSGVRATGMSVLRGGAHQGAGWQGSFLALRLSGRRGRGARPRNCQRSPHTTPEAEGEGESPRSPEAVSRAGGATLVRAEAAFQGLPKNRKNCLVILVVPHPASPDASAKRAAALSRGLGLPS